MESPIIRRLLIKYWPPLRKRKRQLAVWGWWQGDNLGDNWIKQIWQRHFPAAVFPDTSVLNVSDYGFVICGGGGLFVRQVIPPWDREVLTPYGAMGLGAEFPHPDRRAQELAQEAEFFYVRDEYSLACLHLTTQHRSFDLTFAEPLPFLADLTDESCLFIWRDPTELLAFDDFKNYLGTLSEKQSWQAELESIFTQVTGADFSGQDCAIAKLTEKTGFIVSARYHGLIAAIQRGIPCIGIDVCPKIRALMTECGLEKYCLKYAQIAQLPEMVRQALAERDEIRKWQNEFRQKAVLMLRDQMALIEQSVRQYVDQ